VSETKLRITETVLRDGHQSLAATRMRTSDMVPMLERLDDVGYFRAGSLGRRPPSDSCLRFLDEDPWERLRTLKHHIKKTPISMLLRGQNVLGLQPLCRRRRRNLRPSHGRQRHRRGAHLRRAERHPEPRSGDARRQEGRRHVQGAIVYTSARTTRRRRSSRSPRARRTRHRLGVHQGLAGLLSPYAAYDLVRALKDQLGVMVNVHSHYTSGMASNAYLKAIEAGADVVDCALSPFALGTSQPATRSAGRSPRRPPAHTGIDKEKLTRSPTTSEGEEGSRGNLQARHRDRHRHQGAVVPDPRAACCRTSSISSSSRARPTSIRR